jgi:hypothetical protein
MKSYAPKQQTVSPSPELQHTIGFDDAPTPTRIIGCDNCQYGEHATATYTAVYKSASRTLSCTNEDWLAAKLKEHLICSLHSVLTAPSKICTHFSKRS